MNYALCSEVFKTPIEETIRSIASIGFDGIEIAPFNVAESIDDVPASRRAALRRLAADAGIEIVGLHWLLVSPAGLHITTPDDAVRRRSWEYVKSLARFCADIGGKVLVLGSPVQRNLVAGDALPDAMARAADGLAELVPFLSDARVRLLLEPLHPAQTSFLDSIEDAIRLARKVDHPQVGYILDTKAMSGFADGILGSIRKYGQGAGHFHANQPDGLGPGMGDFDFRPVLRALHDVHYLNWISCEPFDYRPDAETVARTALLTLREAEEAAAAGAS